MGRPFAAAVAASYAGFALFVARPPAAEAPAADQPKPAEGQAAKPAEGEAAKPAEGDAAKPAEKQA